jgi:hypothetical protein
MLRAINYKDVIILVLTWDVTMGWVLITSKTQIKYFFLVFIIDKNIINKLNLVISSIILK